MKSTLTLLLLLMTLASCSKDSAGEDITPSPTEPDCLVTYGERSLVAVDPAGDKIGFDYPAPRGKKVGIFYFVWQGAHGYDEGAYHEGDILPPTSADSNSPYDVSELEKGHNDPQQVPYGPCSAMHHWGKPYLDYYVGNDPWVIRRHAQMLAAAGVDVIFIDLTNGFSYLPVLKVLCGVYHQMLREGNPAPQISFVLNSRPGDVVTDLMWLYSQSDYKPLWYMMDGKPLLLAPLQDYGDGINQRLTIRYAWFDSQYGYGGNWYGDGIGKWTWGEFSPQRSVKEQMSVMAASHAHLNIGRSFTGNSPEGHGGHQPANTTAQQRGAGTYFKQQFDYALTCDPDLIFITGWNEWVAQRQVNGESPSFSGQFLGKAIGNGDTYFVDLYNHEYSRDIEPCADDFKDTYYYYMVDYVRRYKGMTPVAPVHESHRIEIDGKFDDWKPLGTRYADYRFDTTPRDHWGFGYKNRSLTNTTGRNDFRYMKVATDGKTLFFYVETEAPITPSTDRNWMRLFIGIHGSTAPVWEGFQWVVNNKVQSGTRTTLQRSRGGWDWEDSATVDYAVAGNCMEIAVPLAALGITDSRKFTVDFKWIDNSVTDGDICECMSDGDSAPDSRFRYRYIYEY